jgi:acyl-CoA dehydrogenase
MWDFATDPDYQSKLDWVDTFLRDEVEPLDLVLGDPYDKTDAQAMAVVRPLQQQVRDQGLWAAHLGPELGGQGYGQLKLALLNELLGRSRFAPSVFGCQAPGLRQRRDPGPLRHRGAEGEVPPAAARRAHLVLLLDDEPHAGADPTLFTTRAERDGDEWVINGEKWFSSNARFASFYIVMVVTNPEVSAYQGMSMFIVRRDARRRDRAQRRRRRRARGATAATATCATRTCGCRRTTCSAARARPS